MILGKDEIKKMISDGKLVKNIINTDVQTQAAGIDLTVGKIFSLNGTGILDFTNEKRKLPEYQEAELKENKWVLEPGPYNVAINEFILLPKNIMALVFPRSSAVACGLTVNTAVWDPGYEGRGILYINASRKVELYKNARFAQMIFLRVEGESEYKGIFKGEDVLEKGKRGL
ncbi:MAG: deoxyuridine 5'-triphosphate nucleotidohydrolase [Candidatus Aenigmarchaeota archaeon]|nr:deoxyuridine 5'-triphosphate nucleotidohydrolase [Candidatus Aenigmarchaeota archaeon]